MANFVAADVTYTVLKKSKENYVTVNAQLQFGDGAKTYAAGGVPLTIGNLGLPNWVENLTVYSGGTGGYLWNYDRTNQKLIAIQGGSHSHNLLLKDNETADATSARVVAAAVGNSGTLGAHSGADITVSGTQVSASHGGIQAGVAGAGVEPSGLAIPAQTLLVVATGW